MAAYRLVESLRGRATDDERVLRAILETPREAFVPEHLRAYAYEDTALSIGAGQTISQPTIVAMMTAALALEGDERVLEIGTGSGYQAAVIARLCAHVVSAEAIAHLRQTAAKRLQSLGIANVTVIVSRPDLRFDEDGPFDAIIVTAAAPAVPRPLLDQLRPAGRLVIPVGSRTMQELVRVTLDEHRAPVEEHLGGCRFVPLVGPHGFSDATE